MTPRKINFENVSHVHISREFIIDSDVQKKSYFNISDFFIEPDLDLGINNYLDIPLALSGYPLHRENRESGRKKSMSGKTQGIWKCCQNTGNLVCSSFKFPDSKAKVKDISKLP